MAYKITESCVGCTLCAKSCPVESISGAHKSAHVINTKRCVSCGVCGKVCPTGAVLDENNLPTIHLNKDEWKKPAVDSFLCSACSICVELCRFKCLQISIPSFVGDTTVHAELASPDKCVGCSLCAKCCPIGAITMKAFNI